MEELLAKLDLGKFVAKFKEEDIDLAAASKLGEDDLKELGLTLGARKKLFAALHPAADGGAGGAAPLAGKSAAGSVSPASAPSAATGTASAPAPAHEEIADVRDYHWLNGGKDFVEYQPAGLGATTLLHHRIPTGHPKGERVIGVTTSSIRIWDVSAGQSLYTLSPKPGKCFGDADVIGNLLFAVGHGGSDDNNEAFLYDYGTGKELASYQALKEGGFYHTTLNTGASGSLQALCSPFNIPCRVVLFDIGPSSIRVASKFEITNSDTGVGGQIVHGSLRTVPGHPSTYVVCGGTGFTGVIDTREKRVVRKFLGVDYPGGISFPPSSNGQLLVRGNIRSPVKIFDFGTGKAIYTLPSKTPNWIFDAAAMYANAVAAFDRGTGFIYFYDLRGAPAEITEPQHELKVTVDMCMLTMSDKYVVGSGGNGNMHAISL